MKLFDVYPLFDIHPVKGEGCYIFDGQGNKYLDLYGGHAVISVGHSHPHFVKKLTIQLQHLGFYSNSLKNDLQIELAKKLGKLSNCEEYNLFLCNSGAEANENALKLASFQNKKTKIIAFKKGFHGRTSAAVSVTDNVKIQAPINKTFETELHNFNEIETIEASLKKGNVCAVIIEGIQGIGGVEIPKPKFLEVLESLCKKYNTILILDEIQSGYGRSGEFFAFQKSTITPDIITIAKGMGNGFPIGGIFIHPSIEAKFGMLGTTFGGNHLACVAGLSVLNVIEEDNLMHNVNEISQYFIKIARTIPQIKNIKGRGLMLGLEFDYEVSDLRKKLIYEYHIFTGGAANKKLLRILPPLNVKKEHINQFFKALVNALDS